MRALASTLSLLALLATARLASAVCTASDVMQCGATCWKCSGNTCTIGKLLTVTPPTAGAACTFDFGTRDIVLASGGFTSGSNPFEIRAHGLTVGSSGTLKATGNQVTPGGIITLTLGAGGFTLLKSANTIDVTGAQGTAPAIGGGGSLIVQSDGDVSIAGAIVADGTTTSASGGVVMMTAGRLSGNVGVVGAQAGAAAVSAAARRLYAGRCNAVCPARRRRDCLVTCPADPRCLAVRAGGRHSDLSSRDVGANAGERVARQIRTVLETTADLPGVGFDRVTGGDEYGADTGRSRGVRAAGDRAALDTGQ